VLTPAVGVPSPFRLLQHNSSEAFLLNESSATALHSRFVADDDDYMWAIWCGVALGALCLLYGFRKACTMNIRQAAEDDVEAEQVDYKKEHREQVFEVTRLKKRQVLKYGEDTILGKQFALPALLRPPDAINEQNGTVIKNACISLLQNQFISVEDFNPEVFICFASGYRPDSDTEPHGPGVFFAAALTKYLYEHDVQCYSSVMLPRGTDPMSVSSNIKSRFSNCRVLIVVETAALYESAQCFRELSSAIQNKLQILPLRFEEELPEQADQWSKILSTKNRNAPEHKDMLATVQTKMVALRHIPEPPGTIPQSPPLLDRMFALVASVISSETVKTSKASPQPIESETSPSLQTGLGESLTDPEDMESFEVEADNVPLRGLKDTGVMSSGSRMSLPRQGTPPTPLSTPPSAPRSPPKFCPECGAAFGNAKFCPECGTKRLIPAAQETPAASGATESRRAAAKRNIGKKSPSDDPARKPSEELVSGDSNRSDPLPASRAANPKRKIEAGRTKPTPVSRRDVQQSRGRAGVEAPDDFENPAVVGRRA